ncbi:MAG: tyrosine-type recombinase/integrase, partial [Dermatophilaceae bacterium]
VRRYIEPAIGKVRLDRLKADHVRAMLKGMEAEGLSAMTRQHAYAILHRALAVAVKEQRVTRNVAALVEVGQAPKNPHGSLSRAETYAMLDLLSAYADDGRWDITARYLVALLCGLRQAEAIGLRWEDVDLEQGVLYVRRSVQWITGKGPIEQKVKSARSERTVPLMPPVLYALVKHRESAPEGYVWGGVKPVHASADYQIWRGLLWSAGCQHHPLHSARSTAANILHEAGAPDRVIADILGHAKFEVTWSHYLSSEERQLTEAIAGAWRMLDGAR